ncbi:acyl- --sterol O-acyltransferase 1-like [Olea europaea subsp. europaea]|uniref:Acyl- --sterol O-acyltransferase 1-like n=1 Tax=Olea europaea subsp. europaea TaxID=158383 RepID=A0A8S0SGH6_OLEEU|nr:acyl- --sterol O-acyltransferase 1-like [Olea europaea subsp. europaea]
MEGDTDMNKVLSYWMEGVMNNFFILCLSVLVSLSYCYFSGKILSKGTTRLVTFLPVIVLFLLLPLNIHSVNFVGFTSFSITMLANLKLLMFAFNKGPLSDLSELSLPTFLAIAGLPIKLKTSQTEKAHNSLFNYARKGLLLAFLIKINHDYSDYIHQTIILGMYSIYVYFFLEIGLAIAAAMVRALLGIELEPQFNEPYLSTSLHDFWGRRWNIMVSRVLRPMIYIPVRRWSINILGQKWAALPAIMSTFVVSGLIHELIFFYLGRAKPTWEVTWFFVLQGAGLTAEIAVKKSNNKRVRIHVPKIIARIYTVGFLFITGFWLFFPPLLRCKALERGVAEYGAAWAFVKDVFRVASACFAR